MSVLPRGMRLGTQGLSLREELLLMTMLRLVRPATHSTHTHWQFVSEQPCDVCVGTVPKAHNGTLHVLALHHGDPDAGAALSLHFPLRVAAVEALVEQVENRLHQRQPPPRPSAPVDTPRSQGSAFDQTAPATASPLLRFADQVQRWLAAGREIVELAEPGKPALLVVECWRRQFLLPAERSPAQSADAWLPAIEPLLSHCEFRSPTGMRDRYAAASAPRRSVDRLLWGLGMLTRGPLLLAALAPLAQFQLRHWPDFGALGTPGRYIKLAALLVRQPYTLRQLQATTTMTTEEIVAFLNASALCGLLKPATQGAGPSPDARWPLAAAPQANTPAPPAGMRGLLERIRNALHLH